jgi:hypothetical protein
MNIECPKCNSTEFTKLSLIHAQGFSDVEARSRGCGLLFGSGGADLAFGSFRTKGEIQTRLSQRVSPRHKWSYWKIVVGGLIGLLILEFILVTWTRSSESAGISISRSPGSATATSAWSP